MKFWTIQSQEVLNIIDKEGIYHPNFSLSQYHEQYFELYNFMLNAFNVINNTNCQGLIYSFCISCKDMIYGIRSYDAFRELISINKDKVEYLWDAFINNDCRILELETELTFNDLALAFNDFQYIMPNQTINSLLYDPIEYQANCKLIFSNIEKGILMSSGKDLDLIQSHLPYIKKSDIKNVYKIFSL